MDTPQHAPYGEEEGWRISTFSGVGECAAFKAEEQATVLEGAENVTRATDIVNQAQALASTGVEISPVV